MPFGENDAGLLWVYDFRPIKEYFDPGRSPSFKYHYPPLPASCLDCSPSLHRISLWCKRLSGEDITTNSGMWIFALEFLVEVYTDSLDFLFYYSHDVGNSHEDKPSCQMDFCLFYIIPETTRTVQN